MKAWQLLDSREKWCQGAYARDHKGNNCEISNENAIQWCAYGSIFRCYRENGEERLAMVDRIATAVGCTSYWNDTHTYEEVHALLKELDI